MSEHHPEMSVSNSEIQTFLHCRRRWWLSYYRRLRPLETALVGPLPLGSRVHKALELYYKGGEDLIGAYNRLMDLDTAVAVAQGTDLAALEAEGDLGRVMLEGFIDWSAEEGLDSLYEVVGIEEVLTMPMLDGSVEVKGKLDVRVRDKRDGSHLVRDWKTVAQSGTYSKWAHMNPQIMTYQTLDFLSSPEDRRIAGAQMVLLRKVKRGPRAKPPFYELVEVRHNVFTLRSFWVRLQGILRDMLATKRALDGGSDPALVVYPTPSRDCSWICFAGDTEVVTRSGIKQIKDLADTTAELLIPSRYSGGAFTGDGRWEQHRIERFGEQEIVDIRLRRGRQVKTVRTTAEHLWWVDGGARRVATADLEPGTKLPSCRSNTWKNLHEVPFAIVQGFVFGDGSTMGPRNPVILDISHNSPKPFMLARFSGHRMAVRNASSPLGTHTITRIHYLPDHWKQLPDIDQSPAFLASWLAGYIAADGSVSKTGQLVVTSSDAENLEFVRSVCGAIGIKAGQVRTRRRLGTGAEASDVHSLSISTRQLPLWMLINPEHKHRVESSLRKPARDGHWTVEAVQRTGVVEPVYCAVVPGDEAFTLADDLVTSNCPFYAACPMFDDGSGAEDLIAATFQVGDPYDYYRDNESEG